MLQNKPLLRKLNLARLMFDYENDEGGDIYITMDLLSAQIGKMDHLRELHLTSIPNGFDEHALLFCLKDLRHLHLRVESLDTLYIVNEFCPNLQSLHIEGYDSNGCYLRTGQRTRHIRLKEVLEYLQSSACAIQTMNLSSTLYGFSYREDICSISDVQKLCRASKTLQTLIVFIELSDDISKDDFVLAASNASNGRVVFTPASGVAE